MNIGSLEEPNWVNLKNQSSASPKLIIYGDQ